MNIVYTLYLCQHSLFFGEYVYLQYPSSTGPMHSLHGHMLNYIAHPFAFVLKGVFEFVATTSYEHPRLVTISSWRFGPRPAGCPSATFYQQALPT